MIEFFITWIIMIMSTLNIVGSLIWIGFWLSIVYTTIGKSFFQLNWLKRLRNGNDCNWKVVSSHNSSN